MSIVIALFWIFTWTAVGVIGTALYLLPTGIAFARKAPDPALVAVVNIAFGVTAIGWLVALVLALRTQPANTGSTSVTVINQPHPTTPPPAPPQHVVPPVRRPGPVGPGRHRRPQHTRRPRRCRNRLD